MVVYMNPTSARLRKKSMFKNVRNPFLQLSVVLDVLVTLVVEAENSVYKPLRNVDM